ncbi:uncharacterized protein LOC121085780 [Falco naumanni]|uniref:uncharacterized protein LOC121085780 n=1 Tax=Falco naumanni TaxID=148594 RepID=UPI001ADDEB7D|nr:uncharacterized protein LOC121085780 [Falco naumanni]
MTDSQTSSLSPSHFPQTGSRAQYAGVAVARLFCHELDQQISRGNPRPLPAAVNKRLRCPRTHTLLCRGARPSPSPPFPAERPWSQPGHWGFGPSSHVAGSSGPVCECRERQSVRRDLCCCLFHLPCDLQSSTIHLPPPWTLPQSSKTHPKGQALQLTKCRWLFLSGPLVSGSHPDSNYSESITCISYLQRPNTAPGLHSTTSNRLNPAESCPLSSEASIPCAARTPPGTEHLPSVVLCAVSSAVTHGALLTAPDQHTAGWPPSCQPRPWDTGLMLLCCAGVPDGDDGDALGPICPGAVWHMGWDRVRRKQDQMLCMVQAMPPRGLRPPTVILSETHFRKAAAAAFFSIQPNSLLTDLISHQGCRNVMALGFAGFLICF